MQAGDRTFIIDKLDRGKNAFEHAFIFQDKAEEGSDTVTSARGSLIENPNGLRPTLHLEEGHRLSFKARPSPDASPEVIGETTEFALADTPLGRLSKDIFRPRGEDERELTLPELFAALDNPPPKAKPAEVASELSERLVNAVSILILPFLAIPFRGGFAPQPARLPHWRRSGADRSLQRGDPAGCIRRQQWRCLAHGLTLAALPVARSLRRLALHRHLLHAPPRSA